MDFFFSPHSVHLTGVDPCKTEDSGVDCRLALFETSLTYQLFQVICLLVHCRNTPGEWSPFLHPLSRRSTLHSGREAPEGDHKMFSAQVCTRICSACFVRKADEQVSGKIEVHGAPRNF